MGSQHKMVLTCFARHLPNGWQRSLVGRAGSGCIINHYIISGSFRSKRCRDSSSHCMLWNKRLPCFYSGPAGCWSFPVSIIVTPVRFSITSAHSVASIRKIENARFECAINVDDRKLKKFHTSISKTSSIMHLICQKIVGECFPQVSSSSDSVKWIKKSI